MYSRVKRAFDLFLALLLLIPCVPVMILIWIIIRLDSPGPGIFKQQRAGYKGHLFTIYKFRTMRELYDESGALLPDVQRLGRLGKFLRTFSLDELPQLFNVIAGRMSFVGPRPLLPQYLERYSAEQGRRHDVPPGITGWAQVKGRNNISWEDKLALDIWYVDHCSSSLDLHILFLTLFAVANHKQINRDGYATMPEFQGTVRRE